MNRSRTIVWDALVRLWRNIHCRKRAVRVSGLSHPAAIASSGLRSITQKQKRPPLSFTKIDARNDINGGEVSATTTSKRCSETNFRLQSVRKLAKFSARRIFVFFPSVKEGIRTILIPFHVSRLEKRRLGSS